MSTQYTLKVKKKIECATCMDYLPRVKSFKVSTLVLADAKLEIADNLQKWNQSLIGQNCRVCQSIIDTK